MSLVVFENVSLSFGGRTIVDGLDLRVAEDDRIGLVGPNGSGKTTLLRMLAGEQAPDGGRIQLRRGVRLGYLPQDLDVQGGRSLLSFVRDSVPGRAALDAELAEADAEMQAAQAREASEQELTDLGERLASLHERLTHFETHYTEHEAMRILAGLGFQARDRDRDVGEFSGGWKMRAVLAALLFQQPDLMLLDEPTNHLDMPSVTWFSDFLQRYPKAFFLISHDREFLNEQIRRVVTFEVEGVRQYTGNYERYVKQRAEEEEILENKAKNLEREREQAQRFIDRFRAQANKARAVQSRIKQLEKMESVETYRRRKVMRFKFPPCERCSNDVLVAEGIRKAYGAIEVLKGVDLRVTRGQRVAIIGPNGAGKTTLLRILAGELARDAGEVKLGSHVKLGYFAQHHADTLHRENTVFQEVASQDTKASVTRVRTVLGAFLFSGDDVDKKVSVLSGGERARVALARLLINPGNFLLMDEPTNHLDLASSESLADALSGYDGTLLFVSHNRSFVRKLATQIWNLEDGLVEVYQGGLDDYMYSIRQRQEGEARAGDGAPAPVADKSAADLAAAQKRSRAEEKARKRREAEVRQLRAKVIRPLEKRMAALEQDIERHEAAQKDISAQLADPAVYGDETKRNDLLKAFEEHRDEVALLTRKWERLSEELEAAEAKLDG